MGSSRKAYDRTGPLAFPSISGDVVLSPNSQTDIPDKLTIGSVEVGNSSGANASVGWGYIMPNAMWKAGQWDDSETVSYIDDTTDAQDAGTSDFAISTVNVNNDGFVVQSLEKFNILQLNVGTAQNGAGTVEITYWNGAWTVLPTIVSPTVTGTGATYLIFLKPIDWTRLAATDAPVATDGLSTNYYAIRFRYTTAPATTAGLLSTIKVINLLDYVELVTDGSSMMFETHSDIKIPFRASITGYCSAANAANWIDVEFRQGG